MLFNLNNYIFMHPLDFLSEPPNIFIFQKETNKTNFGGVLFFIYFIIIIIITIYYYIDYTNTDNFKVQYKLLINLHTPKEIAKINANNKHYKRNNEVTFYYKIDMNKNKNLSGIKLYDYVGKKFISNGKLKNRVNDTDILVLYECPNNECIVTNSHEIKFYFEVSYKGFVINHQNESSPFNKERWFIYRDTFYFDNITVFNGKWHNIIYKEKKGFLKKNFTHYIGYIDSINSFITQSKYIIIENKTYLALANFFIDNIHFKETEYERTQKSILDYIANIFSFYSNAFFIAKFIFRFYSQNFNNFKIIENVIQKKNRFFDLSEHIYSDNNSNNDYVKCIDNNRKPAFVVDDNIFNEKKIIINENNDYEDNEDNEDYEDYEINASLNKKNRKLRFIHFFLNNLYCNCCYKFKPQKIIHTCNEILLKLASIDSILYNQILLENLFKDYRWNNPNLNTIDNNELIFKLKTMI